MGKFALVLCSGGLDSSVLAHYVKRKLGHTRVLLVFFDYGQIARKGEERSARYLADKLGLELVKINIPRIKSTGRAKISNNLKDTKKESDAWYFPFRNTIFISHAVSIAEKLGKGKADIFLGFKCEGEESYPDTTQQYVKEMNRLISIATDNKGIRIIAPFIKKDKEDIIALGDKLNVDMGKTISCYCSDTSCGECLACRLRKAGFYWANVKDPTIYKSKGK